MSKERYLKEASIRYNQAAAVYIHEHLAPSERDAFPLGTSTPTETNKFLTENDIVGFLVWGAITGNIENQLDLMDRFSYHHRYQFMMTL